MCAIGLFCGWLSFIGSWFEPNAAMILSRYATDTASVDLWALFNGLNGILCLYLWQDSKKSAFILLYALLMSGCYFDVLWWAQLVPWASFKGTIDLIFIGEMAVIFLVGGRDAANRVSMFVVRWSRRHSHSTARVSTALVGPRG